MHTEKKILRHGFPDRRRETQIVLLAMFRMEHRISFLWSHIGYTGKHSVIKRLVGQNSVEKS